MRYTTTWTRKIGEPDGVETNDPELVDWLKRNGNYIGSAKHGHYEFHAFEVRPGMIRVHAGRWSREPQ